MRFPETTRAALASTAKVRTIFNLACYEVLVIFLIIAGEGLLFAGYEVLSVSVQTLNIILVTIIVVTLHGERAQLVEVLALISVFGVVTFAFAHVSIIYSIATVAVMYLPLILVPPTVTLYAWMAFYGVMFIPITAIVARRKLSRYDLGLTGGLRSTYLIPLGTLIGVGFGLIEFAILPSSALIPSASALELIRLSIVIIFFVALVEELLFRALLQPQLIERSGALVGIIITSVLFGAVHAIYGNVYELLFTTGASLFGCVAFYKTKSLPFVITIHAVDDIFLWGVLPFLL